MEYTEVRGSPEVWRRWSGISLIAAALEQRVWMENSKGRLFPHLYTILVGPPGVGKSVVTSEVEAMLKHLTDDIDPKSGLHVSPSSVTHASLIDTLVDAERSLMRPPLELIKFNSLAVCSNELAVFLPEYDTNFMSKLTDLWDCKPYGERRRGNDLNLKIPHPQLNILAATTPSYMMTTIPEGAWDQGFLSRTILVFSGEIIRSSVFKVPVAHKKLYEDLQSDLLQIFSLYGEIRFSDEAMDAIENWNANGCPPIPDHPKLINYLTRRITQILKLCMVAAVSEGSMIVELSHFHRALDWLIEVEVLLPDIFKAMSISGDQKAMMDTWYQVSVWWAKEKAPIAEGRIISFISERAPATSVMRIFDVMVRSNMLIEKFGNEYEPAVKRPGS